MAVKDAVPFLNTFSAAQPAAATEFSIPAPGQGLWRVISVAFSLVTDANVANRSVSLSLDDGTTVVWRACAPAVQTAGLTWNYSAFSGAGNGANVGTISYFPLPDNGLWMQPGWRLRSTTANFQAGDRYGSPTVYVEEFPNGPIREWVPTVPRGDYERS